MKSQMTKPNLLLGITALAAMVTTAQAQSWDYIFSYQNVYSPNALNYVVEQVNIQRTSEGAITYWNPASDGAEARLTQRFLFPYPTAQAFLHMEYIYAANFGIASGSGSLWGSIDGTNWVVLVDVPTPAFDAGGAYSTNLPNSLLGSTQLWIQARLQTTGWNILAQFLRYDMSRTNNAFDLKVKYAAEPQSWLTNGLVAYYPFNGDAVDVSGNALNGTVHGATLASDRFGKPSAAYFFNGSNSYISINSDPLLQLTTNLTISFWMKGTLGAGGMILCKGNGECAYSVGGSVSDGIGLNHQNILNMVFSPPTPSNQWFQVVCTLNGTDARIYYNGQLRKIGIGETLGTGTGALTIGMIDSGSPSYYGGHLDDFRIYNHALSANEVAQLYFVESPRSLTIHKAVYVDTGGLAVGSNYQFQVSSDLVNWTNQGAPFTATDSYWRSTNYWDVENWDKLFFRLTPQ